MIMFTTLTLTHTELYSMVFSAMHLIKEVWWQIFFLLSSKAFLESIYSSWYTPQTKSWAYFFQYFFLLILNSVTFRPLLNIQYFKVCQICL
jgi:hypothetical protein